jgi:hypothetical protein
LQNQAKYDRANKEIAKKRRKDKCDNDAKKRGKINMTMMQRNKGKINMKMIANVF